MSGTQINVPQSSNVFIYNMFCILLTTIEPMWSAWRLLKLKMEMIKLIQAKMTQLQRIMKITMMPQLLQCPPSFLSLCPVYWSCKLFVPMFVCVYGLQNTCFRYYLPLSVSLPGLLVILIDLWNDSLYSFTNGYACIMKNKKIDFFNEFSYLKNSQ